MTEVLFYHLTERKLEDALPPLLDKSVERGWRVAVAGIAILAALITPTVDPVNMAIVMLPLLFLYGLSIVLATWMYRLRGVTSNE